MNLSTEHGEVSIVDEPTFTFGSTDNVRSYPFARHLHPDYRPSCVHGVLLDGQPLAVFGGSGGTAGVNDHSALVLGDSLYLAVANNVVCMRLRPFEFKWAMEVDFAACFGLHYQAGAAALLSHGELQITRFTEDGEIVWRASGADIFTGGFVVDEDAARVVDFDGEAYRFRLSDGYLMGPTGER